MYFADRVPERVPPTLRLLLRWRIAWSARGLTIVYGGGNVGLMGRLADTARAAGGEVIGVIPRSLVAKEVAHTELPDLRIVESMHERKALMADLADAFIAMPGGYGTFEEFCEILTWTQLGLQRKPCGILNVEGYYDHLLQNVRPRGGGAVRQTGASRNVHRGRGPGNAGRAPARLSGAVRR